MTKRESEPSNEVVKDIIAELELVANRNVAELLRDCPHKLQINGYSPTSFDLDFIKMHINPEAPVSTIDHVDTSFDTPSEDLYGGLHQFTAHCDNDVSFTFSRAKYGPVSYTQVGERIIGDAFLHTVDTTEAFSQAAGLPQGSILSGDIEAILECFVPTSKKIRFERSRDIPLSTDSRINILHESTLARDQAQDDLGITQELRFEVLHYKDFRADYSGVLDVPTTTPVKATHIVFHRNQEESSWQYYATYQGPVYSGQFLDEFIEQAEELTLPPTRLSAQVVRGIEESLR